MAVPVTHVLFSRQSVLRMAFVMAHDHHTQLFRANLVEDVVGKAFEARPPEALLSWVESERVLRRSVDGGPQLGMELVGKPGGNLAVVGKGLLDIPPHQRVIGYFHAARSRSMEAQNSSELSGCTRPESNSSRRRAASSMPSALASSWLWGGSESRSQAARVPRSNSGRSETAF